MKYRWVLLRRLENGEEEEVATLPLVDVAVCDATVAGLVMEAFREEAE